MKRAWVAGRTGAAIVSCVLVLLSVYGPAGALDIEFRENLIQNPGFETPAQTGGLLASPWQQFSSHEKTIESVEQDQRSGRYSALLTAHAKPNGFQGLVCQVPVESGKRYDASAYIKENRIDQMRGSAEGLLVIEWRDQDYQELSRVCSPKWNAKTVSKMRWTQISLQRVEAPAAAVTAVVGVHLVEDQRPGGGGFYVDDVEFVVTPDL